MAFCISVSLTSFGAKPELTNLEYANSLNSSVFKFFILIPETSPFFMFSISAERFISSEISLSAHPLLTIIS